MPTRFASESEIADWDNFVAGNPQGADVLQSVEFGRAKERRGWRPRYIVDDFGGHLALEKSFPGLGKFWYFPKGPNVTTVSGLREFAESFESFARDAGVFGYKVEPNILRGEAIGEGGSGASGGVDKWSAIADIERLGFVPVGAVQVNQSTVIVDLSEGAEAAKAKFRPRHRTDINRAVREGARVEAVAATDENCRIMYDIYAQTAAGQFDVRSFEYYRALWQDYDATGKGQLFFVYSGDAVIAGAFVMLLGTVGSYKDGASVREKVVYGASHLLQYAIMEWLAERGYTSYDLVGAPPSDRVDDKSHPFHGLARFKTGFEKHITDYVGAFDKAVVPWKYRLWMSFGERALAKLHRRKYHDAMY